MSGVAVVVVCHDLGRWLEEALASVAAQVRPPAEVLVVDDGSTDAFTRQVLGRVAARGTRVLHKPNGGLSSARNAGTRATSAELLVFLDADDVLDPRYLDVLVAHLEARPALDVVSCGMRTFGEEDGTWTPGPPSFARSLAHGVVHASSLLRRRAIDALGGFDESIRAFEDLDFWMRFALAGFHGEVVPEPLLGYRVRRDSMWRTAIAAPHHLRHMEAFYRRHATVVAAHIEDVYVEKEAALLAQREHRAHLARLEQAADAALVDVERRIEAAQAELRALAEAPLDAGDLARVSPLSDDWGLERGQPADRFYIEAFLARHAADVQGVVLEVKEPDYTYLYGAGRVTRADVVDIDAANPRANVIADLAQADAVPEATYDCFILTQTLHLIRDAAAVLRHAHRALRPGGVLLATVPALGPLNHEPPGPDHDYWRFTEAMLRELLLAHFPADACEITPLGNVLGGTATLYGLASSDLPRELLAPADPSSPVVYGIRAVKLRPLAGLRHSPTPAPRILMFHRVAQGVLDPHRLCVSPARFRRQMEQLAATARPMGLRALMDALAAGEAPPGAVAVTFDDGYLDNLETAAPILAEYGIPATFFLTAEALQPGHEYWWDTLARLVLGTDGAPEDLRRRHDELWARLVKLAPAEREAELRALGAAPASAAPTLDAEAARSLASLPGVEIGAHSRRHLLLPSLDDAVLRDEVRGSKRVLEDLLGRPVTLFAYPFGAHDERVVRAVREAGFEGAVTTIDAAVWPGAHPLLLPRRPGDNGADG